jgi:PAS domain S-box-containing protein
MAEINDEEKTKRQLIEDLQALRQQVAALQEQANGHRQTGKSPTQEWRLLRALLENVPDHIYFKDAESRFIAISTAQAEWFGLSEPDQAVGKTDFDFFAQDHAQPAFEDERDVMRSGQPLIKEEKETWPDGRETWVATAKMPLRDEMERIVGTFGISRDITARKQAEAERERLLTILKHRSTQLETAAEVARAASSILSLDELIPQVVDLARDRFDLYYAGLFQAGTGEAGQRMIEQGHKLEIGGTSMIGWCIANKQARIALDVGAEAVRFDNPVLPETRSELALPLVNRGQAIGALTIQSSREGAFSQEDITALQTMADQLANAIANAGLYDQAQREIADRVRTEAALTHERDLLQALMDNTPDFIFFKDKESRFIRTNKAHARFLGLADPQEAIGKTDFDLFSLEDAERFYAEEQRIMQSGQPVVAREWHVPSSTGKARWLSEHKMPITDETGQVVGVMALARDITERKLAEEDAQRRAAQATLMYEVSQRIGSELDPQALLAAIVAAVRDAFDYYGVMILLLDEDSGSLTLQAISGGYVGIFPDNLSLAVGEGMIGQAAATGEVQISGAVSKHPHYVRKADEKTKSELAVPIKRGQRIIGVLDLQDDEFDAFDESDVMVIETLADQIVTAIENARLYKAVQQELAERVRTEAVRQRAEEALRISEERYRVVVENANEAILVIQDGAFQFVNPAAAEITGYPADNLISRQFAELVHPDDREMVIERHLKRLKGEPLPPTYAFRAVDRDGNVKWVEINAVAVSWEGQPATVNFLSDITEQKQAQEALVEAHEELERYTSSLERQAAQLQVGAQVAREAAAILDVHHLLNTAVHLISEGFGFYHAGAFLLDEQDEYAVLRAASSEGGRRMLERGHKLQIGKVGIVGHVAATGEPRIALDVGQDAVFFNNPNLPATRSEMSLPLKVRGNTIGVLDVQSTEEAAFSEDDVTVLQTLADQLAVAIDNARLVERTEAQLRELTLLQREYDATTWAELASPERPLGYVYDRVDVVPAEKLPVLASSLALERGETVTLVRPETKETMLTTPLKLREQVIGTLGTQETDVAREWSPDEIALVEAVSEQVAQALENAHLFATTQRSAQQMQILYESSRALTSSLQEEHLIRAVLEAVHRALGCEHVLISTVDEKAGTIGIQHGIWQGMFDVFPEWIQAAQYPLDHPDILADVYRTGRTEIIGEWDERFSRELWERFGHERFLRIFMPIKMRDRVIGVVEASYDKREKNRISEEEVQMLAAFMDQAAVALENAQLFEEAKRRAAQLAAAAAVARDATAILDVDRLLDQTVHLISAQFGFYHAGVFLVDEQNEYAVLRAASSEGGYRMLERGHKLPIGKRGQHAIGMAIGIVGYAANTGEPRIALDVGKDAVHFVNPDLPDTRSEMGLPLKVHEQVIGVLDVQSTEEAAFSEEDVAVLQTLADQLATAIANARLFHEVRTEAMRRTLTSEVQQAAAGSLDPSRLLHEAGEVISRRLGRASALFIWEPVDSAFRPVAVHDELAEDILLPGDARVTRQMNPSLFTEVVDGRRICVLDGEKPGFWQYASQEETWFQNGLYVPLTSRNQLMGMLALAQPDGRPLEGLDFVETIGVNLSMVLENARLYQEAIETAEKLKEIDRLKSQFLANMSHELRTPLNSIIGFSRVILKGIDGPLTDTQRTDLQAVHDSGQHLLGLINDILDISKIQAGKMEISFEDTDLNEIVQGVMSTAVALVKDKPIELVQSVPPDLPTIRADPRRIRQVLLNLVGNAAKFTEEGFIHVAAEATPTEVLLSVSDSGIGIRLESMEDIFEAFTQVDGSSIRRAGGTGLGLSISKHFVDLHGGRMWVDSTPNVGSVFYVALPIAGPHMPPGPDPAGRIDTDSIGPEEVEPDSDRRVVLCVDDDKGVISLFHRYLSKQGYRIVSLTDSTAVVQNARRLQPFAITLDVMMPNKDGWQVIQELKADTATQHIPIIVCTIVGDEKERCLSLGAASYMVKPILEDDLIDALERLDQATPTSTADGRADGQGVEGDRGTPTPTADGRGRQGEYERIH